MNDVESSWIRTDIEMPPFDELVLAIRVWNPDRELEYNFGIELMTAFSEDGEIFWKIGAHLMSQRYVKFWQRLPSVPPVMLIEPEIGSYWLKDTGKEVSRVDALALEGHREQCYDDEWGTIYYDR